MSTLKIKVVSGCQDWVGKAGILSKRIHLHWEVKRGRRYAWFWRYCFGESAGKSKCPKGSWGVWSLGEWERKIWVEDTHLGVIRHIGGSWSIWCPKHHFGDEQPATLLLLCDGWARGGRERASLIITAEQLEPFILGGSQVILINTDTVFSSFWKAFPETNSGYDNYAGE